jgi:hypothetical protein
VIENEDEEDTVFTLSNDKGRKGSNSIEAYIEECLSKGKFELRLIKKFDCLI